MSFAQLQTDIANFTHRADLAAVIPTFIKSAEAEFNNKLKTRDMETAFAETALTDGAVALPSDFESWKVVWTTTNGNRTLKAATNEYIRARPSNTNAPIYYGLENSNLICWPSGGSVAGIYYQTIPNMADNDTNWLYESRPDVYLYEALRHANIYMKNANDAAQYAALSQSIIQDIQSKSNAQLISGGPLSARVR